MENKSLLRADKVYVTDKLYVRIPTVGEILDEEQKYFNIVNTLTAVPYQYMVQLDDEGVDFTTISEYELFLMLLPSYINEDISVVFGNLVISDLLPDNNDGTTKLRSRHNNEVVIDEYVYYKLVETLRKVNNIEKVKYKPANEEAKRYLIERERKKQNRAKRKKKEVNLFENFIVALVNRQEFKYDYNSIMDLSYYCFNQSFNQIQTNINFDKTMDGIYSGTVDATKLKDKSCLSWIQTK